MDLSRGAVELHTLLHMCYSKEMGLHRSQILLEERQYRALVRIAGLKRLSISEVARRLIDVGLESEAERRSRRREALSRLDGLRSRQEGLHGARPGDPVAEVRRERSDGTT